jgi:hypothetical protein
MTADRARRPLTAEEQAAVGQAFDALYGNGVTVDCLSHCLTCGRALDRGSDSYCRPHHEEALRALVRRLHADRDAAPR